MSKEAIGIPTELKEIQESTNKEPILDTSTQLVVKTPVKVTYISTHLLHKSKRVCLPPEFYGFNIIVDVTK